MKKVVILVIIFVIMMSVCSCTKPMWAWDEERITIHSGDTLWSIAEDYGIPSDEIENWISMVSSINYVNGAPLNPDRIYPGQNITILVPPQD